MLSLIFQNFWVYINVLIQKTSHIKPNEHLLKQLHWAEYFSSSCKPFPRWRTYIFASWFKYSSSSCESSFLWLFISQIVQFTICSYGDLWLFRVASSPKPESNFSISHCMNLISSWDLKNKSRIIVSENWYFRLRETF